MRMGNVQQITRLRCSLISMDITFLKTSPRVLAKNKWPFLPLSFMPCSKTTKETPLKQWQKQLIPIIRNFNTFFQIQNGISRPSNAHDWKSFKSKELPLPQKLVLVETGDGLLAIDDTGCPKPYAKKTQVRLLMKSATNIVPQRDSLAHLRALNIAKI